MPVMSLAEFARRQGCSVQAVSQAVARGRLARSVKRDARGRPCIIDAELAAVEWATTRSKLARTRVQTSARPPRTVEATASQVVIDVTDAGLMVLAVVPETVDEDADDFDARRYHGIALPPADWVQLSARLNYQARNVLAQSREPVVTDEEENDANEG